MKDRGGGEGTGSRSNNLVYTKRQKQINAISTHETIIPVSPLSFIRFRRSLARRNVSLRKGAATKRVEGGSGEKKKRNWQAFQE